MGCDIHLALERRLVNKKRVTYSYRFNPKFKKYMVEPDTGEYDEWSKKYQEKWHSCEILGHVEIGERIYGMFANLANVRGDWGETDNPEPKGLPEDVGYQIMRDYTYLVDNEYAIKYDEGKTEVRALSEETAQKWVNEYHCKIVNLGRWEGDTYIEKRVTNPDYHSESWATREELETAFNKLYKKKYNKKNVLIGTYSYYQGIISLMKTFEENGDYEVRMVYWFDN